MCQLTFRYLTPIFNFEPLEFSHSGTYKDATYSIVLKQYEQGPASFAELTKYAREESKKRLQSLHLSGDHSWGGTDIFLIVDVIQPLTEDRRVASNTVEVNGMHESILSALRLHSTKGITYELTYHFRHPHTEFGDFSIGSSSSKQYPFSRLGSGKSKLSHDHFDRCRDTFDILLNTEETEDSATIDKVRQLAVAYHKAAFTFGDVAHAFLILMIAFEAMFKSEDENLPKAASRIAKLLSKSKGDRAGIYQQFHSSDPDTFGKIRNAIAHGSPNLDQAVVKAKYVPLHELIQRAIVELLMIPEGTINNERDYYEEIDLHVNNYYNGLP